MQERDRRRHRDGARRVPALAGDRGRGRGGARAHPAWARRVARAARAPTTALFGIVQGSIYPRLRERATRSSPPLDFDGYAIGGVAVGERRARRAAPWSSASRTPCPERKPRYLMGVGTPETCCTPSRHGVDLFDCVLPARNGRHGLLYTRAGVLRIKNAASGTTSARSIPSAAARSAAACRGRFCTISSAAGEITGAVWRRCTISASSLTSWAMLEKLSRPDVRVRPGASPAVAQRGTPIRAPAVEEERLGTRRHPVPTPAEGPIR